MEQAYVLLCLGLDFKRGGFVDRAFQAFTEVTRLDPGNQYALLNIEKIHEEQQQWQEACAIRKRLAALADGSQKPKHEAILAFLENQLGLQALSLADTDTAVARFGSAIELNSGTVPAYLNLGDVQRQEGCLDQAISTWEKVVRIAPERAYLVFDRIEAVTLEQGDSQRFPSLCQPWTN